MVAPIVEEIANQFADKAIVAKVDVDEMGELAQRYRIMNIPTLMVFKNGKLTNQSVGLVGKPQILDLLAL